MNKLFSCLIVFAFVGCQPQPVVVEQQPPVIVEQRRPIVIEHHRPIVVEQHRPIIVEQHPRPVHPPMHPVHPAPMPHNGVDVRVGPVHVNVDR